MPTLGADPEGTKTPARWLAYALFAMLAAWLQAYTLYDGSPYVVLNGDTGDVTSFVAAWLYPERFADDLVLDERAKYSFYITLVLPVLAILHVLGVELGKTFIYLMGPICFLQMLGFFRLGLHIYRHAGYATALAVVTLIPVWTISGDLWGTHPVPLVRMVYAAAFPWLILLALRVLERPQRVYAFAFACGAAAYLHLVSGPSVALACFIALLATKPEAERWLDWVIRLTLGGLAFVATIVPYAILYLVVFPGGSDDALIKQSFATAPAYLDVSHALAQVTDPTNVGGVSWLGREWVWLVGFAGLVIAPLLDPSKRVAYQFSAALAVGLALSSVGIALLDQTIARALDRAPFQLDIVRNLRYLLPVALIGLLGLVQALMVAASRVEEVAQARGKGALIAVAMAALITFFAEPYVRYSLPGLIDPHADGAETYRLSQMPSGTLSALRALGAMPAGTRVLALANDTIALSPRYAARQPVVWTRKDVGMLSYAGHADLAEWAEVDTRVRQMRTTSDPERVLAELCAVVAMTNADVVLLDRKWFKRRSLKRIDSYIGADPARVVLLPSTKLSNACAS